MYMCNVTAETKEMLKRSKFLKDLGNEYAMVDILTVGQAGLQTLRDEMKDLKQIQNELFHHYNIGALPKDKAKTQILLHIDKQAPWENIVKLIFAIREAGFEAMPIYKQIDNK